MAIPGQVDGGTDDSHSGQNASENINGMAVHAPDENMAPSDDPPWADQIDLTVDVPYQLTGRGSTLTAISSVDVATIPYYMLIYDTISGKMVASSGTGRVLNVTIMQPVDSQRRYKAFLAGLDGYPPPNIHARSDEVTVTWHDKLVLNANPVRLASGHASTLTATSSIDVEPTPYSIEIYDLNTGQRLAQSSQGMACSTSVTEYAHIEHDYDYVAYIAGRSDTDPPPFIQATSNVCTVAWYNVP